MFGLPTLFDRRDYSFHRTFPQVSGIAPEILPLMEYNYDRGLTMYDQNIATPPYYTRPLQFGCTGFAATDICTDQDGKLYSPEYTYERTCYMEGHDTNQGCQVRTSMKSLRIFPPQAIGETETVQNRRPQYFNVDKASGRDWFDSFRLALRAQQSTKTGISMGIPWYRSFGYTGPDGIMPTPTLSEIQEISRNINAVGWHDVKVSGEKTIYGIPHLCVKSWQGDKVGNGGWLYMSRECFNKTFDTYGTVGLLPSTAKVEDIKTIIPDLYQWIAIFMNQILAIIGRGVTVHA